MADTVGANAPGDSELGIADELGYRRPLPDFSTKASGASANGGPRLPFFVGDGVKGDMDKLLPSPLQRRLPDLGMAVQSILGFWLLYMGLITLRAVVLMMPDFWDAMARRSVAATFGAFVTVLVYLAMRRTAASPLKVKAVAAALLCLPASLAFASANYTLFYILKPVDETKMDAMWRGMDPVEMAFRSIVEASLSWYFLFAAWAALYVAMSYATQLRAADRRAAMLERQAQDAQLRALRYQINPHFLFNTLNSLSSLVLTERTDTAERMIMNLSTFFRTTLSADPTADVSLEEEIKLQRLYLDIEQIRFPDRLRVTVDVPPPLLTVRVPVLLLQPVIENAVKYGVARSRAAVTIRISAYEEAGRLHIKVKDDGEVPAEPPDLEDGSGTSTGVGMRNVCDRLVARYGVQAGCFHGPDPEGGYTVHVVLPIHRNV
ncbi:MAG TPA: histidine kinase [Allosphingosinicella sp.]|jgi:LytS/YehU family sensor histidine kinase